MNFFRDFIDGLKIIDRLKIIDGFKIKDDNLLLLNSICTGLENYFKDIIKQKIYDENRKGIIFCCPPRLGHIYIPEFIGYVKEKFKIFQQSIPNSSKEQNKHNSKKIQDFLIERIEQSLPKEIHKEGDGRIDVKINIYDIISMRGKKIQKKKKYLIDQKNLLA